MTASRLVGNRIRLIGTTPHMTKPAFTAGSVFVIRITVNKFKNYPQFSIACVKYSLYYIYILKEYFGSRGVILRDEGEYS